MANVAAYKAQKRRYRAIYGRRATKQAFYDERGCLPVMLLLFAATLAIAVA